MLWLGRIPTGRPRSGLVAGIHQGGRERRRKINGMGGGRRRECERYPASHVTRSLVKCRTTGWVKQVGGEILPLAVLRVNFSHSVPPPGTPLLDDTDRVVTIGFQSSGGGNIGYALHAKSPGSAASCRIPPPPPRASSRTRCFSASVPDRSGIAWMPRMRFSTSSPANRCG